MQVLSGGAAAAVVKAVQAESAGPRRIYAGLSSGKYTHSSLEWDITPNSMECLQKYVDEVLTVVHRIVDEKFSRQVANQVRADRG